MRSLLTVVGTRPQYIKYAALADGLAGAFAHVTVDTGQHYDDQLNRAIWDGLGVPHPKYSLQVQRDSVAAQLADMLVQLDGIVVDERPDALLCFGDTTSTLAAALVAAKRGVALAHVEAGERNYDAQMRRVHPVSIPEETNRIVADQLSTLLLCASTRAADNLRAEQVAGRIVHTGDITYDLFLQEVERAGQHGHWLGDLGIEKRGYYYVTVHRALNTDSRERLSNIVQALLACPLPVVFPVHPRTRKSLQEYKLLAELEAAAHVQLLEPVPYHVSLLLAARARGVITDSGGVVREAYYARVPSVLLDDTTEWIDLVESGWSVIAGADRAAIGDAMSRAIPDEHPPYFGTGDAALQTLKALVQCFS